MMAMSLHPTNQLINHVTNWTARGAYCDWVRVTFPDDFAFPHGTNLLTGVTVMVWGEIRSAELERPFRASGCLIFIFRHLPRKTILKGRISEGLWTFALRKGDGSSLWW